MCGIVGIWSFNGQIERGVLSSMNEALLHRGPDDSGLYVDNQRSLGLGHTRLSILDLSPLGHQPMCSDDESIWITYNGEIYNYKEIRRELIKKGYKFKSGSDTEVVVKSFEAWGIECVNKFRGMFALAIWDKNEDKLYLVRDRAGVKPLYYYFNDGLFMFGSELKALMKHPEFKRDIDYGSIEPYLTYGYIPSPNTIFQNTYKLKPGHYICVSDNSVQEQQYWNVTEHYQNIIQDKNEDEIIDELERLLIESFKYRLVSDVPVGVFLSGGIDSSTLCALLSRNMEGRLKTFSIGFHESTYNEAEWAKKIAQHLGTDHTEHYLSASEAFSMISELPEIYDEPFGDNSSLPTLLLSKLTRQEVKVALSADGGDELFGGYNRYYQCGRISSLNSRIPNPVMSVINSALGALSPDLVGSAYSKLGFGTGNVRHKFLKLREMLHESAKGNYSSMYKASAAYWMSEDLKNMVLTDHQKHSGNSMDDVFSELKANGLMKQMMAWDFKYYLADDILTKLDRASMSTGLEARDPFLDQKIIEFAAGIPLGLLNKDGESKYPLRRILYKYVPKQLLDRPKQGFSIPLDKWLRKDFNETLREYLNPGRISRGGIFNPGRIDDLVKSFLEGSGVNVNSLWCLLMFEMWKERWVPS